MNETSEISSLAAEGLVLLLFHDVELPSSARYCLVALLDKFDLKKIKGINRGREILLNMAGSRCVMCNATKTITSISCHLYNRLSCG
jgi:hypothetical protein